MISPGLSNNDLELSKPRSLRKSIYFVSRWNAFDIAVILICVVSFVCSWIESILNVDSVHWGLMYGPALDIMRGAIPHSGTLIAYGYLSTLIQSVALALFGENLTSIGIITGIFYSLTLFLSYRMFLRCMPKHVAFIAVTLIFLIHPYIIYPWSNYFEYTFQLLALISFLKYPQNKIHGFLAGLFLSLSLLSRYSSAIAILPPFIILLGWDIFHDRGMKKGIGDKIGLVSTGFFVPLIVFFMYLAINTSLDAFFYQNRMIVRAWGTGCDGGMVIHFLKNIAQIENRFAHDGRGKLFTILLIVILFAILRESFQRIVRKSVTPEYVSYPVAAIGLVAIFGYLNAMHLYETFRLVNGASLGFGLCVLLLYRLFVQTKKPVKLFIILFGVLVCFFLSKSLFFVTTSSCYYPWKMDVLFKTGVSNKTIGIFKGKRLTKEFNGFYQEAFNAIVPYKKSCHIINYTEDCVAFLMNDLPRVQLSPLYLPCVEDSSKQRKIIEREEAVILSEKPLVMSGYEEILKKNWPDEIPWLKGCLYIYAPKQ